jgi:hypothetical protein
VFIAITANSAKRFNGSIAYALGLKTMSLGGDIPSGGFVPFGTAELMLGQSHLFARTLFFALILVATCGWLYLLTRLAITLIRAI